MRRPMFPKQTQLQNSTLAIHTVTAIVSYRSAVPPSAMLPLLERRLKVAGGGTMSGFTSSNTKAPPMPTREESTKPVLVPSTRYHKKGLTRAKVRLTCWVDSQGKLRCIAEKPCQYTERSRVIRRGEKGKKKQKKKKEEQGYKIARTIAKAIPTNTPIPLIIGFQSPIVPESSKCSEESSTMEVRREGRVTLALLSG